jgi:hypothetical protein
VLLLVHTIFHSFRKQFPETELEPYNTFLILWTWHEETALYSSNNKPTIDTVPYMKTLREEYRLRVFENSVLRRIFGPKRDEVTGVWR